MRPDDDFLIVGIGASAGGIKALKNFFAQVPEQSGIAYVVILHLSPDHSSNLAEVLQHDALIPVTQVVDRVRIEPDHVYVIPPNKSLSINDGHLSLSEIRRVEERRAPVDIFFRSLADTSTRRAICVVLSGTGPNGSMGMKRVKEMGGICIVQDPREAEYSDMPRNSIATGLVDYVLPVAEMPRKIIAYKERFGQAIVPDMTTHAKTDEQSLRDIFTQLRVRTGHDFSNYKRGTVMRRIERRVNIHRLSDLQSYARFLRENPLEAQALLKDLLISVTNFFRDCEAFETLERAIIRGLFHQRPTNKPVRVWVAGCATGEEAYTLAILLHEYRESLPDAPLVQIFATDIDEHAINAARAGFYSEADVADVSPERLRRFFDKKTDGYRVRRELREMVIFAYHNLLKDPPFSNLDMISCRNLLIYLNRAAQERVVHVFHFALNPGGFLFIGPSESVEGSSELFMTVDKEARLYQSRTTSVRPVLPVTEFLVGGSGERRQREERSRETRAFEGLSYADLHRRLVELYGPPSVVVNEEYDILHLSERAGRYMQVSGGEPTLNLLRMVHPDLRIELRTALYQAVQNRTSVEARPLPLRLDDRTHYVNLIVRPVFSESDPARGFILVLFKESDGSATAAAGDEEGAGSAAARRLSPIEPAVHQAEDELVRVQAQLRATVEQYETQTEELKASNEELQVMNEELRASAEELETSREELQSVNEELTTVNQELKIKIEELSQANDDFKNLMSSTDIGTIFLDRALRIKLFTPRVRNIFNLIQADAGRPLSDITSLLTNIDLLAEVERVLATLQPLQHEVETRDGDWYLMNILPYRTTEERIEGVVVTFLDITKRKKAEGQLYASEERLRMLIEGVTDYSIIINDPEGRIEVWNPGAERMFGYTRAEAIGQSVEIIFTPEDRERGAHLEEMRRARRDGRAVDERWHLRKDGSRFYVSGVLTPLGDDGSTGFAKIARDLTESKQAEEELRHVREELEQRVEERTRELAQANEALRRENAERRQVERARMQLLRQLVRTQEDERRRIARDIHDHLGQQSTALRLNLEALKKMCDRYEELCAPIEQVLEIAAQLDADVDFLVWELRPASLDDLGLATTLANFANEWSKHFLIPVDYHSTGMNKERPSPGVEASLYRIAQEALNNICKHAQASRVDVLLERRDHHIVLIVEDDGIGFNPHDEMNAQRGLGLLGMRERVALIGGTLEIESAPQQGTTIFARVPLSIPEEGAAE